MVSDEDKTSEVFRGLLSQEDKTSDLTHQENLIKSSLDELIGRGQDLRLDIKRSLDESSSREVLMRTRPQT